MFKKIVALIASLIALISSVFGGYRSEPVNKYLLTDAAYGSEANQTMDIAFPRDAEETVGLVLLIHGGAWMSGSKDSYRSAISYIADAGYVCASVNYRYMSDRISVKDMLDDISSSLSFAKSKAAERGITLNNVLLAGYSAGAHLSLLYAYSVSDAPVTPAAVVSFSAPTDFYDSQVIEAYVNSGSLGSEIYRYASMLCGTVITAENQNTPAALNALKSVSPIHYVNRNTVPTVVCHGVRDTDVPYVSAELLDAALTKYGVTHEFITYENSDHSLSADPDCSALADSLALRYAKAYLG